MNRRLRTKIHLLAPVVMTFLLLGCKSDPPPETAALGALEGHFADFADQEQAQWNSREASIQRCMTEEGFDYLARPFLGAEQSTIRGIAPPIFEGEGYRLLDWISTLRQQIESPAENPNRGPVASLPPGERAGWVAAYGGSGTMMDTESFVLLDETTSNPLMTDEAPDRGGCLGRALQEVGSPHFLEPFADELEVLLPRFGSYAGLVQAEEDWSLCMAEIGHPYTSPAALFDELQNEALELAFTDQAPDEFADRELQIAAADSACRDSTTYGATAAALDEEMATEIVALIERASGS